MKAEDLINTLQILKEENGNVDVTIDIGGKSIDVTVVDVATWTERTEDGAGKQYKTIEVG
jgi:hypothetical protein